MSQRPSIDSTHVDLATRWLAKFERALRARDRADLVALFADECHWRDLLAFTWTITPHAGVTMIVDGLLAAHAAMRAEKFHIPPNRTPPRMVRRIGVEAIEAIFSFETKVGRCNGVVRLPAAQSDKAWVLMTSLHELKGYEEPINERRPDGEAHSRNFGGANWADLRTKEWSFTDRDAKGFKQDMGEDGTGHQMKLRRRFGGYYLNCGCSELIISGEVGLLQWADVERFVPGGLLMKDGSVERADLVVTATGYSSQEDTVREMLGDEVGEKIGQIWGIDTDGELATMFRPTAQRGLWFAGGGLAHSRIYSRFMALQIKAREIGLIDSEGNREHSIPSSALSAVS
jgi:hypothetical protein